MVDLYTLTPSYPLTHTLCTHSPSHPLTPPLLPHPSHLPQIPCRYFMHRNSLITRVFPIRLCVTTSFHLVGECSHSMLPSEEHSCWQPSVCTQVSTGPIPRPQPGLRMRIPDILYVHAGIVHTYETLSLDMVRNALASLTQAGLIHQPSR